MKKQTYLIYFILAIILFTSCQQKQEHTNNVNVSQNNILKTENTLNKEKTEEAKDVSQLKDIDVSDILNDPGITAKGKMDNFLMSFEKELGQTNLKLKDKVIKDASSIGALEGYGFNVNGFPLEVYLFDPTSSDKKAKENLKTAVESGFITIFGVEINGKSPTPKCTVNGSLVMIFPTEDYGMPHPNKETIVQAFKEA